MLPLVSRVSLSALVVLQALQPAVAWNRYAIEEPCCGEIAWNCCEPVDTVVSSSCGCEAEPIEVDECGRGSEAVEAETSEPAQQPEPAQTNKPQSIETLPPQMETPQPALDESEVLPPAPINVPTTAPAADSESNELFPGPAVEPAVPADEDPATSSPTNPTPTDIVPPSTPTAEPATPSDNAGGLFDEPAAETFDPSVTEPAPAESSPVDDVFGESAAPAEESNDSTPVVEEESVEVESSETETPEGESTEEPAADPLDDLFGPSSAIERPELNHEAAVPLRAASGEFRQWSNRSTDFQCQGRLIRMTTEGVFVALPNGKQVAIAFSQLSDADLAYAHDQVQVQRAELAQQGADSQIASH